MFLKRRIASFMRLSRAGDISDTVRARLFRITFLGITTLVLLGALFTGGLVTGGLVARSMQAIVLALLAAVWLLWRRGRVTAATYLVVWGLWAMATLVVLSESGEATHWLVPQFLLIILSRFLLNGRVAILMGLLTAVGDFLIYTFSLYRFLPLPLQSMALGQDWPAILISFLFLVFIFFVGDTVLRESLLEARRTEGRYRSLFEHTNDAVFLIDPKLNYLEVNQQAAQLLGYVPHELAGKPISEVIAPTEVTAMKANFARLEREGLIPLFERTFIRRDGSRIIAEVGTSVVSDEDGKPVYYQSVMRDITERKRLEDQLRYSLEEMEALAMQDPLTGLLNRRAVAEHAEAEWHRAQREGRPLCLVLIDVDNLKKINDRHGHSTGDQVILELARAVKMQKRRYDGSGRWGGDEFLLVLPGVTLSEAGEVAERVRNQYLESSLVAEVGTDASVSLGVACYSGRKGDDTDFTRLLNQADQALYKAKQSGKNQMQLFRDDE